MLERFGEKTKQNYWFALKSKTPDAVSQLFKGISILNLRKVIKHK